MADTFLKSVGVSYRFDRIAQTGASRPSKDNGSPHVAGQTDNSLIQQKVMGHEWCLTRAGSVKITDTKKNSYFSQIMVKAVMPLGSRCLVDHCL